MPSVALLLLFVVEVVLAEFLNETLDCPALLLHDLPLTPLPYHQHCLRVVLNRILSEDVALAVTKRNEEPILFALFLVFIWENVMQIERIFRAVFPAEPAPSSA